MHATSHDTAGKTQGPPQTTGRCYYRNKDLRTRPLCVQTPFCCGIGGEQSLYHLNRNGEQVAGYPSSSEELLQVSGVKFAKQCHWKNTARAPGFLAVTKLAKQVVRLFAPHQFGLGLTYHRCASVERLHDRHQREI